MYRPIQPHVTHALAIACSICSRCLMQCTIPPDTNTDNENITDARHADHQGFPETWAGSI